MTSLLLFLGLWLSPAAAAPTVWAVGPSMLYSLPGASAGLQRVLAPRVAGHAELFGEGLSGSLRLGGRVGADYLTRPAALRGGYIGARLSPWWVHERHVDTVALGVGMAAGWRFLSAQGRYAQLGAGVTRPVVLTGDSSFRYPLPVLELRLGRLISGGSS